MPASMAACALTASLTVIAANRRGAKMRMCSVIRVPLSIGSKVTVVRSRTRGNRRASAVTGPLSGTCRLPRT